MTASETPTAPPLVKRSRAKLWIRTGILAVFGTLFAVLLYRRITMSFDRIHFAVILLLVIVKAVVGRVPGPGVWADVAMCVILGLIIGRLSGICLRVCDLGIQHDF